MRRKAKHAGKLIEDWSTIDLPDSQKEHYARLGYKPYLCSGGKVKWLSFDQHIYEKIKYDDRKKIAPFKNLRPSLQKQLRVAKRLFRAFLRNWFLLFLAALIVLIYFYYESILNWF